MALSINCLIFQAKAQIILRCCLSYTDLLSTQTRAVLLWCTLVGVRSVLFARNLKKRVLPSGPLGCRTVSLVHSKTSSLPTATHPARKRLLKNCIFKSFGLQKRRALNRHVLLHAYSDCFVACVLILIVFFKSRIVDNNKKTFRIRMQRDMNVDSEFLFSCCPNLSVTDPSRHRDCWRGNASCECACDLHRLL